jgi:hypothetical protein
MRMWQEVTVEIRIPLKEVVSVLNELKILIVPTPFSKVPRNKVVALQIVNKHLTLYGNKRLIAVFIRNSPPLVPILRQMKPVYTIALKCFKWSAA